MFMHTSASDEPLKLAGATKRLIVKALLFDPITVSTNYIL